MDWVQARFAVYVLPPPWSPFFLTLGVHLAMRRVLHLRMVSQCAMLEDFGIFLVLADKVGGMKRHVVLASLTTFVVALCLPYRSARSLIAWSSQRFADTPKAQWEQGCAILYRRQPRWQDIGHLYEEEECLWFRNREYISADKDPDSSTACSESSNRLLGR